ncbi:hypothetical protein GIS00_25000 [Nakamurella sp. YIM 132087]|uniref:Cellulase family glycosylhydrolase n=1 Tax=Nakamurella alba TaxID=2665158 RepID=A0A7K1FSR3_9ACTN|nr:hypothetical protein [Nakamurella alba]MTD17197.1 hypothetical protein [Nakamurella alba]
MRTSYHPRRSRVLIAGAACLALATLGPVPPAAAAPPTLKVTNDQLVFLSGAVQLTVTTSAASVDWTLSSATGAAVSSGTQAATAGAAVITLNSTSVGYYRLDVETNSTEVATASGSLVVIPALPVAQRGSVFGVGAHTPAGYQAGQLTTLQRVGFGSVRLDAPWNDIEKSAGVYTFPPTVDAAVAAVKAVGGRPLIIAAKNNLLYNSNHTPTSAADLAAFGDYAEAVVDHYGEDDVDLEIYNEYMYANTGSCGTTPACFQTMIDAVDDAVSADHPQTPLAAAGIQSGTSNTVDLTVLDATITHEYVYPAAPEAEFPADMNTFVSTIRSKPGGDLGLWLTEYGWPTPHVEGVASADAVSEDAQADYLVRGGVFALAAGLDRIWFYDLVDDGYDPRSNGVPVYEKENHFGLMRLPAGGFGGITPKPALLTQAIMIRQLAGKPYYARSATDPTTYAYRFGAGTSNTRVLWSTAGGSVDVHVTGTLTVTDRFGATHTATPTGGVVRIALSGHPQYVTGTITGVTQA